MVRRAFTLAGALCLTTGLAILASGPGCGSAGTGVATLGISTLVGTAAIGNPLANATVLLKDKVGVTRTATTTASGAYVIDVNGLTAPFLVKVTSTPTSTVLFTIGTAAGVANVHPFTNLILDAYYDAQGLTLTTVFDAAGAPSLLPTTTEVDTLATVVRRLIGGFLQFESIDPSTFSVITTPFDASASTGFDRLLDGTTITADGHISISNANAGGTSQQSATVTAAGQTITFQATTTSGTQTSTTTDSVTVVSASAQTALDAAIAGVKQTVADLNAVITAQGANLNDTHILPFLDAAYLDRGDGRAAGAVEFADDLVGQTVEFVGVDRVISFTTNEIHLIMLIRQTKNGVTVVERTGDGDGDRFKKQAASGKWLFLGDQRISSFEVRNNSEIFYQSGQRNTSLGFRISAQQPKNTIQGVTVTGIIPPATTSSTLTLSKNPFSTSATRDSFEPNPSPTVTSTPPPAGSVYTFALAQSPTGTIVSYDITLGGSTTEQIDITFVTVQDASGGAFIGRTARDTFIANNLAATGNFATPQLLGKKIILEWTKPSTASISRVEPHAFVQDASNISDDADSNDLIPVTGTLGSVILPATVTGGGPVKMAQVSVNYTLEDGSQIQCNLILKDAF